MFAPLALAAQLAAEDPSVPFEKYQLPNGLTVILSEDHRLPQVAVDIWYHVGAADQVPGKSGFAHLFEHMMFSGAKHIGPAPFQVLEGIGTSAGAMANGTTSEDRTNYFEVVPSAELPTALWLESDRMAFLLDTLDEKKLDVQRDVVSNERRQSYENRAYGTAELRMCDLFYPKPHPYYDCVIGTIAEIQSASMDDLRGFFRQYYAPNNASISIVGNFDPAQAKALVAKYFGPIPRQPDVVRPDIPQPPLPGVVAETIQDQVAKIPAARPRLGGGEGVRPRRARGRRARAHPRGGQGLAALSGAGPAQADRRRTWGPTTTATCSAASSASRRPSSRGTPPQELAPIVEQLLDDVRKNGVTADEVERAKRVILADKLRGLERIGGFGGKADLLNRYEMFAGRPRLPAARTWRATAP